MLSLLRTVIFWAIMAGVGTFMFRQNRQRFAAERRHFMVTQGGGEFRPAGEEFNEAVVSVLMGGAVLDLRSVGMGTPPRKLDVITIMGGLEVIVPEDWTVRMDVRPMLGGARDARTGALGHQGPADLVITGRVIMGGLEVRSQMPQEARAQKASAQQEAA